MKIYPKEIDGHVYYYAQHSERVKRDPEDRAKGKGKGSGPSKVVTKPIYLGTAETVVERCTQPGRPQSVRHRAFGFAAALYQTAIETGLVDVLKEHIRGVRFGLPRWVFFLVVILNRPHEATSKARMGQWAAKTVLPTLLGFDPDTLDSQTFWYVTDDVISERDLKDKRKDHPETAEDLWVGLDDGVFRIIEETIFQKVRERYALDSEILLYDTTNFFTYIEEPVRAKFAWTGHNKECHHHLRQVGLALCVDKEWGLPLFYRMYRGNAQDAKTFGGVIEDLLAALRAGFANIDQMVIVLDKGNNSEENFAALKGQVQWVGSLVPSHYSDLMKLPLESYEGQWESCKYHRCTRNVMGIDCVLVLTYSDVLKRKQEHSLQGGMTKLTRKLREKWATYKRPLRAVPAGVLRLQRESSYGKCLNLTCVNGQLDVQQDAQEVQKRRRHFGKNLLFSGNPEAEAGWVITQYRAKDRVEDDFKLLKNPELIRWRPCRHWTDTKIRAFGFCCIMALVLVRVMEMKAARANLKMSPIVLKRELDDVREITIVEDEHTARTQISERSTVQQQLYDLFKLNEIENLLTLH